MKQYLELMQKVLDEGTQKNDRTGTGTLSIFGHQMRFNLQDGFPLVTTKRCHLRSIIHELLWFLQGDTNIIYTKTMSPSGTNGPMKTATSGQCMVNSGAPGQRQMVVILTRSLRY